LTGAWRLIPIEDIDSKLQDGTLSRSCPECTKKVRLSKVTIAGVKYYRPSSVMENSAQNILVLVHKICKISYLKKLKNKVRRGLMIHVRNRT